MRPLLLNDFGTNVPGEIVERLRQTVSRVLVGYFWLSAIIVVLASCFSGGLILFVALPLTVIGAVATAVVQANPSALATRLVMTVAINSTWMFGLYVASDIHNGEYMLEVHMLYFINTSIILAYVCWRSVLMTTIAALVHHSILTLLSPELVWPTPENSLWHLTNHYVLGTINCLGGIYIAMMLKRFLDHMESSKIEAQYRSNHDDLTGLLNRRGLRQTFQSMSSLDTGLPHMTLFQIDLDEFKNINDTAGHTTGDKLLTAVGKQLSAIAPPGSIVARIGGDEFVVASPDIDSAREQLFLREFNGWIQRPHDVLKNRLHVGASVGITSSTISGVQLDGMMVDADIALYEAKKSGRNRAITFEPLLKTKAYDLLQTAEEVILGMKKGEFEPFFQTQHDIRTGALVGVEVLARWHHPTKGVLAPAVFLDAIHETGKAATFDKYIMERALDGILELEKTGIIFPKVSFNVSFQRLTDSALVESLCDIRQVTSRIAFELVESVFFDNLSDEEVDVVNALRDLGIGIEIDDFGTGHASIIALTRLKPDLLKIDRALISPLSHHPGQIKLLSAIVDMAQGLGIEVLAEGVETEEEINKLRMIGVDYAQGYAFSKPLSLDDLQGFLMHKTA